MKRTVLITGATSGLGKLLALKFSANAETLIVMGRDPKKLHSLVTYDLPQFSEKMIIPLCADLNSENAVRIALKKLLFEVGAQPDTIIHCAADFGSAARSSLISAKERNRAMQVNYFSPALMNSEFINDYFKNLDFGRVIHVGSMAGLASYPLRESYSTSKHALAGYSKTLDEEFMNKYKFENIRCHYVAPGPIAGKRAEKVIAERARAEGISLEEARANISGAIGNYLDPHIVVNKIAELCRPEIQETETVITFP